MKKTSSISEQYKKSNPVVSFFAKDNPSSFFKPFVQPKLAINQPNDTYEQEATAMADKVMRMADKEETQQSFFPPGVTRVQQNGGGGESREKKIQHKENSARAIASPDTENYIDSLPGGRPLNEQERNFFEPKMGYDLSAVRLHTDSESARSARDIHALAYTHGSDIVFAANQYQPGTDAGKRLMAHELTHFIQQNRDTGLSGKMIQRHDDPSRWCDAFMELVRYEDDHGKWGVLTHYNSLAIDRLVHLNYNVPSIYGDVDVDWMFKLALIQYPFIVGSIVSPAMAEGFGTMFSRAGQIVLKAFWNTIRAPFPEWKWEYASIWEEGNWNSSIAIIAWIHHDLSLREIFEPAIPLC